MPDEEDPESDLVEIEHRERFGKDGDVQVGLDETWIKIALGLRKDLELKIPRDEVEEMSRVVMRELDVVESGCTSTVVGGFEEGTGTVQTTRTTAVRARYVTLCPIRLALASEIRVCRDGHTRHAPLKLPQPQPTPHE
ncbi:hypothetical protein EIP86_010041 [Pleurotus ostreatoroseus]|nr:hypothetical protein EIP86_010041 [Pleurotus ostreatoroseus]